MEWNNFSNLVEDLPRNNLSFGEICQVVMEEMLFEVVFFLFLALLAILFRGEEQFEQFW